MKAPMLLAVALAAMGAVGVGFVGCGSNGGNGSGGDGGSDATNPDTGGVDGHSSSSSGGDATMGDSSGGDGLAGDGPVGDGAGSDANGLGDAGIFNGDGGCFTLGTACNANGDCCSGDCTNHVCILPKCTSDGQGCSSDGACCSLSCVGGTCGALNTTCSTIGNACGGTTPDGGPEKACCSNFCIAGQCQQPSYCSQAGDTCATAADCCSQVCTITGTQALGICGPPPSGPASCSMPDGTLCAGTTADGGIVIQDGGVPACGGSCCSRSCAPWGPTGVLVCQPASGCKIEGDICTSSAQCCGGAGSGEPQAGLVTCLITAPALVGICRSPTGGSDAGNACIPNGDVCKLATTSCSKDCNCCTGNCNTDDTCKQDNLGIPRCTGAACVDAGTACSSSADCCNGNPCVPSKVDGGPEFTCYPFQCVQSCGSCSNNADCCPGSNCLNGTCDPCGGGTPGDGGAPGDGGNGPDGSGLPPDGGAPPPPDGGCASYGQVCATSAECCNGVPCTPQLLGAARCVYPIQ